jgi:hypothetical protein
MDDDDAGATAPAEEDWTPEQRHFMELALEQVGWGPWRPRPDRMPTASIGSAVLAARTSGATPIASAAAALQAQKAMAAREVPVGWAAASGSGLLRAPRVLPTWQPPWAAAAGLRLTRS